MQLRGAQFWLVGASEGIGRALAIALAAKGATLAISARQQDRLDSLLGEMAGSGHIAVAADVTNAQSLREAYAKILAALPGCHHIIFNAGTYTAMKISQWDLATCERTMEVNVGGALKLLDVVLPQLRSKKQGRLVMVSSVAAYRGLPKSLAYGASKAALTNLTESLRIELEPENVTVQLVSPGFVKTRLTAQNDFSMPLAITAARAAEHIVRGIEADAYEIHFPRGFTWFMKLLRILPNPLFFALTRRL